MTITDMDPKEIREIIETGTVRTAILTPEAVEKYKDQFDGCTVITVEGMTMRLNGFKALRRCDGTRQARMYVKAVPELGQLLYAVSDHDDAEQVRQEIFPGLINMANQTGLILVDIRAVAAESIGSLKRAKGVTTTEELKEILDGETTWK